MSDRQGVWARVRRLVRAEPETYATRQARPGDPADVRGNQYDGSADQRRGGGSMAIGG